MILKWTIGWTLGWLKWLSKRPLQRTGMVAIPKSYWISTDIIFIIRSQQIVKQYKSIAILWQVNNILPWQNQALNPMTPETLKPALSILFLENNIQNDQFSKMSSKISNFRNFLFIFFPRSSRSTQILWEYIIVCRYLWNKVKLESPQCNLRMLKPK